MVYCVGGPLNEKTIDLPDGRRDWEAPLFPRQRYRAYEAPEPIGPGYRVVRYRLERMAYSPFGIMQAEYPLLVADGYPVQRVLDAVCALWALLSYMGWLYTF